MQIIQAIPESKGLLTLETEKDGRITGQLATIDGDPLPAGAEPVEVYMDSMSGNAVARVSHAEAESRRSKGEDVAIGHGAIGGWFVDAPDYTVNGRHGDKATA